MICVICQGEGKYRYSYNSNAPEPKMVECFNCKGTGIVNEKPPYEEFRNEMLVLDTSSSA
jgi:DnaJ-class molecular chaperone